MLNDSWLVILRKKSFNLNVIFNKQTNEQHEIKKSKTLCKWKENSKEIRQ